MFAELVINIEAPLEGTFHYSVPRDMARYLKVGHLVEVEFGRRLAQGIVLGFTPEAEVEDTKPILSLIDNEPVVQDWQIELARRLSQRYLTPLNGCLRLFLPPGLTRWADVTVTLNRFHAEYNAGTYSRLTPLQKKIVALLKEHGDLRGRKLRPMLPKGERKKWQTAVNQLAKREIVRKATVLDRPRVRPKSVKNAELIASPAQIEEALIQLGRKTKASSVLYTLLTGDDPLPSLEQFAQQTGVALKEIKKLAEGDLLHIVSGGTHVIDSGDPADADADTNSNKDEILNIPDAVGLSANPKTVRAAILKMQRGEAYGRALAVLRQEARPMQLSEIYAQADVKHSHLKKLAALELIRFGAEEVWRDPLADRDFAPAEPPMLTADQARVWGRIKVAMLMAQEEIEEREEEEREERREKREKREKMSGVKRSCLRFYCTG